MNNSGAKTKIIFLGNGPLADATKNVLAQYFDIVFHARTKDDLEKVKQLKNEDPSLFAILASYGVLIKDDILQLFEPEGILNIHPSNLPDLRGASPIESAILRGDTDFTVSIMKLAKAMDAGPLYYQETIKNLGTAEKSEIYQKLATAGATWLAENLNHLPEPKNQQGTPTFCGKFDTSLSPLDPTTHTAAELNNQVRAFQVFPKSRYEFFGHDCIILSSHIDNSEPPKSLAIKAKDGNFLIIDRLQPAGKKPMDAKSFLNGYAK